MSSDESNKEQDLLKRDENNELRDKIAILESGLKSCQDKLEKIEANFSNMFKMYYINRDGGY